MPLALIGRMYRLERQARREGIGADELVRWRAEHTAPVLDELKTWLERTAAREPPRSGMARACRYSIRHWTALTRFLEDGRLSLDNNLCELQIRSLAVGRKNYLFAGSHEGAQRAAILYSVLRTCARVGVDPEAYLADVLIKLAGDWPQRRIDELLPDAWLQAHPEHRRTTPRDREPRTQAV